MRASRRVFFSEKWHISRILDMTNSQKVTFKLFLVCGCSRRGFFFWKMTHFHIFWHDKFPKSVFLVKNSIFGVINCQNIDIFAHILGPLTNDPFIKKFKIAPKAQPGIDHVQSVITIPDGLRHFEPASRIIFRTVYIDVRDSRTGYLVPVRDGPGASPDLESCWDVAAVIIVPGTCSQNGFFRKCP